MANILRRSLFAFRSMARHDDVISIIPQFRERARLLDTEKVDYIET
jgi:NTE family protein